MSEPKVVHGAHEPLAMPFCGQPSRKRKRAELPDAVDAMLLEASISNLHAGLDIFGKLRCYGLRPSQAALQMERPTRARHFEADAIVKEAILQSLETKAAARARAHATGTAPGLADAPGRADWTKLPLDVALQIVSRLDTEGLYRTACTCPTFKDLIACVITSLSFSWCADAGVEVNAAVRGAGVLFQKLQNVYLYRHVELEDSSLAMLLAANGAEVHVLDLGGCSRLTDATLFAIAEHCPELRYLDVSSCRNMTNPAFIELAKACPSLQSLNACGCEMLTDTGVLALSIHCNQLSKVNLGWCHRVTDFGVSCLARGCRRLTMLDLCGCWLVSDCGVAELASKCSQLTALGLHCLRRLTDDSMAALAHRHSGLLSLNVSGCVFLSHDAVQEVLLANPGLHTCASRRSVMISGCTGLVGIQCGCLRAQGRGIAS